MSFVCMRCMDPGRLDRLGITRQISHLPWLACPVALGQEAMRGIGCLYQELDAGKLGKQSYRFLCYSAFLKQMQSILACAC
ncbi:hypothetical protein AK812_SmicGene12023 [Symbiodinium microadriaticum]|uniref:Uncharacterized protein n=1 Tax=Symbiodinium microadriaticum TaxID=2951 RepID=A0A1Q9EBM5_SYMMI|nr:hypothetical protein AK812_SmicGene12023 [Symbiodinium microadriaticum]